MPRPSTLFLITALSVLLPATASTAGTLDVAPEATWSGDFGLAVVLDDTDPAFVETTTPNDESRYIVRFYFNADALSLGAGDSFTLFQALSSTPTAIVTLRLQSDGGSGRELVYTVKTDAAQAATTDIAVGSGWHVVELDWAAATSPGANDGFLTTQLDGEATAGLTTLDNDQSTIATARWGAVALTSTPTGTLWVDDFASRRSGAIGPILAGSLDLDGDGSTLALTDGILFLRSIFGFTGATLIGGAVGGSCTHCTAPEIQARLGALHAVLDVDDNGVVGALTDGLLVVRYLFGFTGSTLTNGAVGANAERDTGAEVTGYLLTLE